MTQPQVARPQLWSPIATGAENISTIATTWNGIIIIAGAGKRCAALIAERTAIIRSPNEGKVRARWKVGCLLAKVERATGPGRGIKKASAGLTSLLQRLALDKQTANEARQMSHAPCASVM